MVLPLDLILVRHGESEFNLAISQAKNKGDFSGLKNKHFQKKHSSTYRLTKKGVEQSKAAGKYIKENIGVIDKFYVSEYIRAMETAALLDIKNARWRVSFFLRERDFQKQEHVKVDDDNIENMWNKRIRYVENRRRDGFFYLPPQGESLAHVCQRVMLIIQELHNKCSDKKVLIVCHAETMMAFRVLLECMTMEKYKAIFKKQVNKIDPKHRLYNCQVLHYTRRNPESQKLFKHFKYMKSVCPWDLSLLSENVWKKLKDFREHKPSNEELMERVKRIPLLFSNDSPFPIDENYRLDEIDIPKELEDDEDNVEGNEDDDDKNKNKDKDNKVTE